MSDNDNRSVREILLALRDALAAAQPPLDVAAKEIRVHAPQHRKMAQRLEMITTSCLSAMAIIDVMEQEQSDREERRAELDGVVARFPSKPEPPTGGAA